ncbi:STAS domain-containing protein [Streptomyces sp. NPDC002573]|uniref:STAS domain-containing protein n=1 Tax=Streptomyces sp. NPDC002573 TaxID=3364651 RepID=UPI0036874C74
MFAVQSGWSSREPGHTGGGTAVVRLRGEIDILAARAVCPRLDGLTAGDRPDLVLDLRAVSFVDCAALGLLCHVRNRVVARGGRLRLPVDGTCVSQVLRRAGLAGVFDLCSGVPEGISLASGPDITGGTA